MKASSLQINPPNGLNKREIVILRIAILLVSIGDKVFGCLRFFVKSEFLRFNL